VKHGSRGTYVHHQCRCMPCTEANTEYHRRQRLLWASVDPPAEAHGKVSTYVNWSCRCVHCSTAHAEAMSKQNQKRRIAAALRKASS
jgi:hypothetical protein